MSTYTSVKRLALIIAVVVGVTAVLYFAVAQQKAKPHQSVKQEKGLYHDQHNGFTLEFPGTLQKKEYESGSVAFGRITGDQIDATAEAQVIDVEGEIGKTFQEVIIDRLMTMCAADGPTSTFSCTAIEQLQPAETVSGIKGFVLYLKGELKDFKTNTTSTHGRGPFFVFPLQTSATNTHAVVIHAPLNQEAERVNSTVIRDIALSLKIDQSTSKNASVEEYVSRNISKLSPEKEVLGGKFYVTKIEAHGGAGTVEYEDGHNAFTADFTYTVDEKGAVHVTAFTVR